MVYFYYSLFFVSGLLWGSFLNAWIWRTRENLSIFSGRSMCTHCRQKIFWYDNIPVVSFFILKGKCRYCQQPISWHYPIVEFTVAVLFLFFGILDANNQHIFTPETLRDWTIIFYLVFIFTYDLKYKEILYRMTLPLSAVLFMVSIAMNWHTAISMLLGVAIGAGFFLFQYVISSGKWIGGGDILLGTLMGVILGYPNIILALMLSYILGAIIGLLLILLKKKEMKSEVPFGTFLVVGTLITMCWGNQIVGWYIGLLR